MAANIVAYLRVSTERQGKSGLGLEAQRAAVESHAKHTGAHIAQWYIEIESGRVSDRPELLKAIAHARRSRATLVVAKMDRLSRNASFLLALRDAEIDLVACDNANASRLTVGILAVVAEDEAERISQRTKAALQAAKARGTLLGAARPECRNLTPEAVEKGRKRSIEARKRMASEAYSDLLPIIRDLRDAGKSLASIADELNQQGHCTRHGKAWSAMQVKRVIDRAEAA
ncbi:MAG TPA: recombinase family protein [Gemmataceae bacterium]|nr:recombinase family protein [Gemmataceae bacterium]